MILKQVIHYPDTNSVEATWVEQVKTPAPFIEGQDIYIPPTITEVQVKCHSYADVQMDDLVADLGEDAAEYADLIATVRANIKLPEPPSAAEIAAIVESKKAAIRIMREAILNRLSGIALAAQLSGDTTTTAAYVTVRQGLLDITTNWPADPAQVDALVTARYATLVAQCTQQMVSVFAQVDT